ncbi:unnamed protein product [Bursaphelenchus okinawaensis]|uniref:Uncharacterized protein n=1 Tax=Bursaphelenchus okinawaensis TaxID=465554 RepID=A0A811LPI4_9BILA|nr:unnamed protein product [Bursaphelenchus okinawaensis]CAG9127618.1 unnamed protein product [Bursaphelenchus okinawaensis]
MKCRVDELQEVLDNLKVNFEKVAEDVRTGRFFMYNMVRNHDNLVTLRILQNFYFKNTCKSSLEKRKPRFQRIIFSSDRKRKYNDIICDTNVKKPLYSKQFYKQYSELKTDNQSSIEKTVLWLHKLNELECEKSVELWKKKRHLEKLEKISSDEYLNKMGSKWPLALKKCKIERKRLFRHKLDIMSEILNNIQIE